MAEGDNTSPTDGARERSDWKKVINGGVFGNQVANFDLFYYYLIRRKRGAIVSVEQNPPKRRLPSHKSLCCHRHGGVIKEDPSTINAAAGSLRRRSDNGPRGGERHRACSPGIVRKTDKETREQVISQFMRRRPAQTLTCPAGEEKPKQASWKS